MKHFVAFVLAAVLLMGLCACGNTEQPAAETTQPQSSAPKSLKVLAIGNSFSVDAMTHLYQVAKSEGVEEVVLGNLFYGGCSLEQHVGFMKSEETAYRYDKCTDGTWVETPDSTLLTGLLDEQWDVITMQQASSYSGLTNTIQPYLDELVAYVQEKCPNAKLYWHMTWAYQSDCTLKSFPTYNSEQMTMYYGIVNVLQKVIEPSGKFEKIIPVGTMIQNLRSSVIGDKLTRDGYHLNDLGRVSASYMWYAVLADQPIQSVKTSIFGKLVLTDQQKELIVKSVNAALEKPQAVTPIS